MVCDPVKERNDNANDTVPITADDLERFRRGAAGALERRSGSFLWEEAGNSCQFILMGLLPIGGMLYFGWQASHLLLFLLIGTWVSILCDFAKLALLRKAIVEYAQQHYDDWHVWTVADALRAGRETAPKSHLRAKYQPGMGVVVDIVFGVPSTILIWLSLAEAKIDLVALVQEQRQLVWTLAGMTAYQVIFTIWEIVVHKIGGGKDRKVKVAVGLRGVGMFLLVFVVGMAGDTFGQNGALAQIIMMVVNGALILLGLVSIAGVWMMRGETVWLRDYLEREAQ